MIENSNEISCKPKLWKKVLCIILSIIIAIGTFITLTFGNSRFQKWLGIESVLSAYAQEIVDTKGAIAIDEESMLADNHIIDLENRDGSNTVYILSEPISYVDENGKLKTKDISVEKQTDKELKSKGFDYTNGQNDYRINFSSDSSKGLLIEFGNSSYSIIPQSKTEVMGNENTSAILNEEFEDFEYKNIYGEGTNLKFYPQLNGVKDEIVLNSNIGVNSFSFEIKTTNCNAVLNEDGTVSLISNDNENSVQTFSAPFAFDSKYVEGDMNEHYIDCSYTLDEISENTYILTVNVDKAWLDSENTVYPITIDPTTSNITLSADAGVYSKYSSNNYGSEQTCCFGRASDYGYGYAYTKFTVPSAIKKGATISSAYQWMRETTGRTSTTYVRPYMVKETWSESGITWNNKAKYCTDIYGTRKNINSNSSDDSTNCYWYKFDLKNVVKKWVDGTTNYGVVYVSEDANSSGSYNWRAFTSRTYSSSAMRPYTVINYTNETTKPTINSITKSPSGWTNQNVKFTINATDLDSGIAGYAFSNTSGSYSYDTSKTSGNYTKNQTVYFAVKDKAGNVTTTTRGTYIDKLNPGKVSLTLSKINWTNQNVTVTATATDAVADANNGCSGINGYYYSTNQTFGTLEGSTKTYTSYAKIRVCAEDKATNKSASWSDEKTIKIDKVKPIVSLADVTTNSNNGKSQVHINASDTLSGIKAYSLNGGNDWVSVTNNDPGVKNLDITTPETELNVNSLDIRVKDLAGNVSNGEIVSLENPRFYSYNGKAGILNPNYDGRAMEYSTDGENWSDYSEPFDITESSTVYARYTVTNQGQNYSSVSKEFNPPSETEGVYTESETDLTITNNNLSFDVTRDYSSDNNEWHFSTEASASLIHDGKIVKVNMPDDSNLYFVKTADNIYTDEINGYVIYETDNNYSFSIDEEAYTFSKANGRLLSISDANNYRIEFSYNSNNELEGVTAVSGNEEHPYLVSESNSKIENITTPLGETLTYDYSDNNLVKVYYDKDTLQYSRTDDIIIGEYSYVNNRIETANGNTVNYDNADNYISLTTPAGEVIVNESELSEPEQQTNNGTESEELDFSSDYPIYYEGTSTVHYEKTGYTLNGTAYITENEYNIASQLIKVTETQIANYDEVDADTVYTKVTEYTYFENSDTLHSETVTETENGNTATTTTVYDSASKVVSETVTQDNTETITEYTYDIWGNTATIVTTVKENDVIQPVSSIVYEYDLLNRCVKETVIVPNGNDDITVYAYNPLDDVIYEKINDEVKRTICDEYGRVVQEIEPQDYSTSDDGLSINSNNEITGSDSYSNSNIGHRYVYDNTTGLLNQEINRLDVETNYAYHPNSSIVATESFDIYRYEYNTDRKLTDIFVANTTPAYAHYVYDNGKNTEIHYGNGQIVYYEYDDNKNVTAQKYKSNASVQQVTQFTYLYNTDNELTTKTDCVNHRRTDYSGNTVSVYDISGNSDILLYSYSNTEEDTENNTPATAQKNYSGNTLNVTYNDNSNQYKLNNSDVFSVNSTYADEKLSSTVINNPSNQAIVSKNYTYDNDNNVTGLTVNNTSISYVYDDKITEYHQGNNTAYYHYDSKDQLVREDINYSNYSKTITYTYDNRGNLINKKEYPYTRGNLGTPLETNNLEFEYEDELWLDEIVTTPTETILYDENGNPVNLEDCTLEWTNGRQLKSVSNGNDVILEYTYDDNGIRTSKTYQGNTTYYTTENGIITSQYQFDTNGNKTNEVIFVYDNGNLVSAYYDNAIYYYITNAMGDVISIIDGNGNTVVDYAYDAWGNVVDKIVNNNLTTDFATVNPMLYRSYYYDEELGVYYLQSRYYKADWCRFVNADSPEIADKFKDIKQSNNLYSYGYNNPVKYCDFTGYVANTANPSDYWKIIEEILSALGIVGVVGSAVIPALAIASLLVILLLIPSSSDANVTNTRILDDVKAKKRSGKKEYQFCYIDGYTIYRVGKKMTWKTALLSLGIINTTTDFHVKRNLNLSKINETATKAKNNSLGAPWGIFADSKVAAKTLAVALGYSGKPEVHKSGYYGHYHDNNVNHKIHIWFGKQVWY